MAKFNRILEIDYDNRVVVTQPGVTNLGLTQAVQERGFYYAPDPSSQIACTIGGNVAENSGGVHCLKYGLTTNNVLGVELVLLSGEVVRLGGKHLDSAGLDMLGLIVGSEGLLGVVTEVTVRILPKPEVARAVLLGFSTVESAGQCVADVIAAGIIPAGMEMMDKIAIDAAEAFVHAGYPLDVEALLIVELDGPFEECDLLLEEVVDIARQNQASSSRSPATIRRGPSSGPAARLPFRQWAGSRPIIIAWTAPSRGGPCPACWRGSRSSRGPMASAVRMSSMPATAICIPLILYDANKPGDLQKAEDFGADILRLCVEVGGVLTGEHGVGVEKRDLMPVMFAPVDLEVQQRVKCAFDPELLLNPGKVFPTLHRCAELGRMHIHGGQLPFPDLPRF